MEKFQSVDQVNSRLPEVNKIFEKISSQLFEDKKNEREDILVYRSFFQSGKITGSIIDLDDCPRIASRG